MSLCWISESFPVLDPQKAFSAMRLADANLLPESNYPFMKHEELVECHQILSSRVGSGQEIKAFNAHNAHTRPEFLQPLTLCTREATLVAQ